MTLTEAFTIYWPVIAFTIGGIISVVTIYIKLSNKVLMVKSQLVEQDKEVAELKGRINAMMPDMNTIKTDVAVIKNDIAYIKGSLQNNTPQVTNITK